MKKDKRTTATASPDYVSDVAKAQALASTPEERASKKRENTDTDAKPSKKSEKLKQEINTRQPGQDVDASESVSQE
jgi:hypothetical protein